MTFDQMLKETYDEVANVLKTFPMLGSYNKDFYVNGTHVTVTWWSYKTTFAINGKRSSRAKVKALFTS